MNFEKNVSIIFVRFSYRNRLHIFKKKMFKDLLGDSLFLSIFLKIGLTVVVLARLEYLFKDISLLAILAKWESRTLPNILTNFAEIPSGPLVLFKLSDLISLLIMSLVLPYGRSYFQVHINFWFFEWQNSYYIWK